MCAAGSSTVSSLNEPNLTSLLYYRTTIYCVIGFFAVFFFWCSSGFLTWPLTACYEPEKLLVKFSFLCVNTSG